MVYLVASGGATFFIIYSLFFRPGFVIYSNRRAGRSPCSLGSLGRVCLRGLPAFAMFLLGLLDAVVLLTPGMSPILTVLFIATGCWQLRDGDECSLS